MARRSVLPWLSDPRGNALDQARRSSESNVAEIGKVLKRELGIALQPRPFEVRARIGFTTRRDVRMTRERFDRIAPGERLDHLVERRVLRVLERTSITAFQFDAYRKVVASLASEKAGHARVPCAFVARHVLLDPAIAMNYKMRRHPHAAQVVIVRMSVVIETVLEELGDGA